MPLSAFAMARMRFTIAGSRIIRINVVRGADAGLLVRLVNCLLPLRLLEPASLLLRQRALAGERDQPVANLAP